MNMFYTGLGIARSLGARGVPVIGLSSIPRHYGNYTRYADVLIAPDSRHEPSALFDSLIRLARRIQGSSIIFPTRDDDIVFLDRYREQLSPHFVLAIPGREQVGTCLDKWKTHQAAERSGIPAPKAWLVTHREQVAPLISTLTFPCVLKPVSSYDWRRGGNWDLVGGRKAVGVRSPQELIGEYAAISAAGERVLIEELVPGEDNQLLIAACFCDARSRVVAGFTARKLVQVPAGFGTGCVVETVDRPDVMALAERLLSAIGFHGIAEVEFKRDAVTGELKLIEINARPWDQHRLGTALGSDVIYAAYRNYAGLPVSNAPRREACVKWVAEDAFLMALARGAAGRGTPAPTLFRAAQGRRVFAIWSARDRVPSVVWAAGFGARLVRASGSFLWTRMLSGAKEKQVRELEHTKA
jgi:predicted ATP-grasp superfamily ATP-dependent carboligase